MNEKDAYIGRIVRYEPRNITITDLQGRWVRQHLIRNLTLVIQAFDIACCVLDLLTHAGCLGALDDDFMDQVRHSSIDLSLKRVKVSGYHTLSRSCGTQKWQ